MIDPSLARDIRHAIAAAMAEEGLIWSPRHDYATGVTLSTVSLPTAPALEETRAALAAALRANNQAGALAAANAAANHMRAALVEAEEELARGQILNAQAAIRRGLHDG